MPNTSLLDKIRESKLFIERRISQKPEIAIVFGSGLGAQWARENPNKIEISYSEIPHFPQSTVQGHSGKLIFGKANDKLCLIADGRFHFYEGYSQEEVVYPIRVFKALGIRNLILTNSAGALNPGYKVGDLILIKDHINFTGHNPLRGQNEETLGPRFPDLTDVYNSDLSKSLIKIAKKLKINMKNGVYMGISGPSYETPAEIKMFRKWGGDVIGMSTVPEVIAAAHLGLPIAVISCVTNKLLPFTKKKLTHEQVLKSAKEIQKKLYHLLECFLCEQK